MKLRDILNIYDFERFDPVEECGVSALNFNTRIVRVYLGECVFDPFFEVGMACDCGNDGKIHVADFIRKEILDRKVDRIQASEDIEALFVFLEDLDNEKD